MTNLNHTPEELAQVFLTKAEELHELGERLQRLFGGGVEPLPSVCFELKQDLSTFHDQNWEHEMQWLSSAATDAIDRAFPPPD